MRSVSLWQPILGTLHAARSTPLGHGMAAETRPLTPHRGSAHSRLVTSVVTVLITRWEYARRRVDVSFISDLVLEYGQSPFRYEGDGTVSTIKGNDFPCRFAGTQTSEGRVFLACDFNPPDMDILFARPAVFRGRSVDGWKIESGGALHDIELLDDPRGEGAWSVLSASQLTCSRAEPSLRTEVYRYGITNFAFDRGSPPRFEITPQLPGCPAEVSITAASDYGRAIRRARVLRNVEVTASLETRRRDGPAGRG